MRRQTLYNPIVFGASVTGPTHRKMKRPNEDAWIHVQGQFGTLGAACDGMGSGSKARIGAQIGCVAIKEAIKQWASGDDPPTHYIAYLAETIWRIKISPHSPGDCATTCLFAFFKPDGHCFLGGVGDGLIATRSGEGPVRLIKGERDTEFSNQTSGMGNSVRLKDWLVEVIDPTDEDQVVLLATDGIADDLHLEKIDELLDWLIASFAFLPPLKRWQVLCKELRNWPTPRHVDDKTLVVIWKPGLDK